MVEVGSEDLVLEEGPQVFRDLLSCGSGVPARGENLLQLKVCVPRATVQSPGPHPAQQYMATSSHTGR